MADGEKKECLSMSSKGCQDVIGFAGPSKVRCVLETFEQCSKPWLVGLGDYTTQLYMGMPINPSVYCNGMSAKGFVPVAHLGEQGPNKNSLTSSPLVRARNNSRTSSRTSHCHGSSIMFFTSIRCV